MKRTCFSLCALVVMSACASAESPVVDASRVEVSAAPRDHNIDLASVETEDGALPPGWTALMGDSEERARYYSRDGAIYFEYFGGFKTLSYAIPQDAAGAARLTFNWTVEGNAPECSAAIRQGDNEVTISPTPGANSLALDIETGSRATVRFSCTSQGKIWGWIRQPRLEIDAP